MRSVNEESTNIPEMHTFGKHKKNKPKTFLLLEIMYARPNYEQGNKHNCRCRNRSCFYLLYSNLEFMLSVVLNL